MEQAASQFLRAIRGKRSQIAFARRLGYRANPITDWENGRRFPTGAEALRACVRAGVDVRAAFAAFHAAPPPAPEPQAVADWLTHIRGSTPVTALSQRSGRSRFAIGRWLQGQAQPRLPDFFRLVDAITGRLPDLVALLCPIEAVPQLVSRHRAATAARGLAFVEPWTEAVLRLLETTAYAERGDAAAEDFLAERLGIEQEAASRALGRLLEAGIVRRVHGELQVTGNLTVDTRADPEATGQLLSHWSEVALGRHRLGHRGDLFAYNVLSISEADLVRVRELLRSTYREVRSIVAASEPAETAAVLNLQLVEWGEPKT